jgi:hypothetical protein
MLPIPSRVAWPLQPGPTLQCFLSAWDDWFVRYAVLRLPPAVEAALSSQHSSENTTTINPYALWCTPAHADLFFRLGYGPTNIARLYGLAHLALYLQMPLLLELVCGVFAFAVRALEAETRRPGVPGAEAVLRAWERGDSTLPPPGTGDLTADERVHVLERHRMFRDPQRVLERLREFSETAHEEAAAVAATHAGGKIA